MRESNPPLRLEGPASPPDNEWADEIHYSVVREHGGAAGTRTQLSTKAVVLQTASVVLTVNGPVESEWRDSNPLPLHWQRSVQPVTPHPQNLRFAYTSPVLRTAMT